MSVLAAPPLRRSSRLGTLAPAVLTVAAAALALTPAPPRAVALPVLALVAGYSAMLLVLGRARAADDGGPVLRAVLPVVFGLLALLAAVLLLGALGFAVTTEGVVISTSSVALVLALARIGVRPAPGAAAWRPVLRRGLGVVAGALVLAGAVAGAIAVQPVAAERYTQIALQDPLVREGGPLVVRAGDTVGVALTLSSYGYRLAGPAPLDVAVDGRPVQAAVGIPANPAPDPATSGATSSQDRSVGFTAPTRPGRYPVRITVTPQDAPDAGSAVLILMLQVNP